MHQLRARGGDLHVRPLLKPVLQQTISPLDQLLKVQLAAAVAATSAAAAAGATGTYAARARGAGAGAAAAGSRKLVAEGPEHGGEAGCLRVVRYGKGTSVKRGRRCRWPAAAGGTELVGGQQRPLRNDSLRSPVFAQQIKLAAPSKEAS